MKDVQVRVAYEFKLLIIDKIRAMEVAKHSNLPSSEDITRKLIKYIDPDEVWQKEYGVK